MKSLKVAFLCAAVSFSSLNAFSQNKSSNQKSDLNHYTEAQRSMQVEAMEAQQCELRTTADEGGRITPAVAAAAMAVFVVTLSVNGGCRSDSGAESDLIESAE